MVNCYICKHFEKDGWVGEMCKECKHNPALEDNFEEKPSNDASTI